MTQRAHDKKKINGDRVDLDRLSFVFISEKNENKSARRLFASLQSHQHFVGFSNQ